MFLPHFTTISGAAEPAPARWLLMMHGIYGRGGNWRTVARKVTALRPDWGVLLVDLRMHGKSMAAQPPHTLAACAADVLALVDMQASAGHAVGAITGHSFGGKVALSMRAERPESWPLWLVDSSPSSKASAMQDASHTVVSVLRMLEALPAAFGNRQDFVSTVQERGFPLGLAQWLAMNLEPCDKGYRNALDPSAMRDLLQDYFSHDLWPAVELEGAPIRVAVASRGSAISSQDLQRFRAIPPVICHELEGGHWLHVDAPEPLVALISESLG
ncbi:MAG: alpha/beta hydrolase [Myxococcales bacterium]|nr:alpha/beta hydrolase [Myxococcales bacterium]